MGIAAGRRWGCAEQELASTHLQSPEALKSAKVESEAVFVWGLVKVDEMIGYNPYRWLTRLVMMVPNLVAVEGLRVRISKFGIIANQQ